MRARRALPAGRLDARNVTVITQRSTKSSPALHGFAVNMNGALDTLLSHPRIWRARSAANVKEAPGLASGYPELDRHLPGGGWPREALTEILIEDHGKGELQLLMPALARLSRGGVDSVADEGWIVWIAPPFQPYPPALTQWGVDLSRLLIVRPHRNTDIPWAAEQALASGNCTAVLLWPGKLFSSRRLQLAAEEGRSWAIAFRAAKARSELSAAALRLELVKGERGTDVVILKSRGGRTLRVRNLIHDHAG